MSTHNEGIIVNQGTVESGTMAVGRGATAAGSDVSHQRPRPPGVSPDGTQQTDAGSQDGSVFVVHGHDERTKLAAAHFLEQVTGRYPIILQEQPNAGQTIIEKLEQYAGTAAFAVVLLTGDDQGSEMASTQVRPRARQNVVLELGYFLARLGRSHVAVLYEPQVELPSDVTGILYTALDPGGAWRMELAREMRAAGVSVDLNQAV
jgi:predicted nucleotide-binding protein